jgi:hypothetical protein
LEELKIKKARMEPLSLVVIVDAIDGTGSSPLPPAPLAPAGRHPPDGNGSVANIAGDVLFPGSFAE